MILQVALDLLTVIDNILDASNADSIDCNVSARWERIYWKFSVSTMINEIKILLTFSKKFFKLKNTISLLVQRGIQKKKLLLFFY